MIQIITDSTREEAGFFCALSCVIVLAMHYDVLIVGGGPAGTKCALELGAAGKKVGLIERDAIGGVCLNRGCIPSKSYLYMVELLENIKKAKRHGIDVGDASVVWEKARKRKDQNVKVLGMGLRKSLECKGVDIIEGEAMVTGPHNVQVGEQIYSSDAIVMAVGSRPLFIPIMQQGKHVISSTEILNLEEIPESLAIIGGGVTGVEMATVFSALGTKVHIFEMQPRLLPMMDEELTAVLQKSLEKKGVQMHLGVAVQKCEDTADGARVSLESGDIDVSKALVCIGRRANYDLDAFDKLGIEHDGRTPSLNEVNQTSVPSIYIIGDAAWRNLTAYGGEREAEVVAGHILGHERSINYDHIPVTVFSHPEVAHIGLREEDIEGDYEVRRSKYAANAKAIVMSEREGLVKIVSEPGAGRILGVHMVGAHAADLIHQCLIPVMQGMNVKEWLDVVWSHPVLSEVIKTALENGPECDQQ